jgi:hypothetical protein
MSDERRKTIQIPEGPIEQRETTWEPMAATAGDGDDDDRDVSKPVAFDAQGRPLYAPRGFILRWRA